MLSLPDGPAGNGSLLACHSRVRGRQPSLPCWEQKPQCASRLWPRPGGGGWERVCGKLCSSVRALPGEGYFGQVWQVGKQNCRRYGWCWVTFPMFALVQLAEERVCQQLWLCAGLLVVVVTSAELCWRWTLGSAVSLCSHNHRMAEVGRYLWRSSCSTPLLKQGYLELVT